MTEAPSYPKVAQMRDVGALRARLAELRLELPVDDRVLSAAEGSPLAEAIDVGGFEVGNRWCIHAMEGWDANTDGSPSEHTLRRWRNFGLSGAKLIWGGEAAAVRPDGRANPNQTLAVESNRAGLAELLDSLRAAHRESFKTLDGLFVGLQLTHSGRFCKPNDHKKFEPRIAYHHPLLAEKYHLTPGDDRMVFTDAELEALADDYVRAAHLAAEVGFQFVDVKACHGYLLHEFLSARTRPGKFGGDLAGRSRLLLTIIDRIREELPQLIVGVRLSVFDSVPFASGRQLGRPMNFQNLLPYQFGFGVSADDPMQIDLTEPLQLIRMLVEHGVAVVNLTCGSPYYNPHMQRPAIFPPTDGYLPPEDPLVGVCRQIHAAREVKRALAAEKNTAGQARSGTQGVPAGASRPMSLPVVGTGYTYLQEYVPNVGQAVVREDWVDFVGLGRMVLSYPEMPADTLAGRPLSRKRICRTFSDCTTAPRNGLISGCYPLDPHYKELPEREKLVEIKQAWE